MTRLVEDHAGERLFARYAHAPNALGYCGPADAAVLVDAACGRPADPEAVRRIARQFSGAWPYQQLIGELAGLDALSVEVGRAYWTGSAVTDRIDREKFGELLLGRFGSQAGHYWAHLTPALLAEASPTHAFHVFGIYPWTRLLTTGAPEPVHVLESCRIRAGRILSIDEDTMKVSTDQLTWTGSALQLVRGSEETIGYRLDGATFIGTPQVGQTVAIHWGFACDQLSEKDAAYLIRSTADQITVTNMRLDATDA